MTLSLVHQHRFYRDRIIAQDLVSFTVVVQETDLFVLAETLLAEKARQAVFNYRYQLEEYIRQHPAFLHTLSPLPSDPHAPPLVREMMEAARRADVGPMASVAGALAKKVGEDLLQHTEQVVIENGGDIYVRVSHDMLIGVYAGSSPLSNRIGLHIPCGKTPLGVCTSSGTVGHSLSFGMADAVTIISPSAALADAAATTVGNCIKTKKDIERGLDRAQQIDGVTGALIIVEERFGAWGDVEIVSL